MSSEQAITLGIFPDIQDARRAVIQLRNEGFDEDIRLVENLSVNSSQFDQEEGYFRFIDALESFPGAPRNETLDSSSKSFLAQVYQSKQHLVVVYNFEDRNHIVGVLRTYGAQIEDRGSISYDAELRQKNETDTKLRGEGKLSLSKDSNDFFQVSEGDDMRLNSSQVVPSPSTVSLEKAKNKSSWADKIPNHPLDDKDDSMPG